MRKLIAGGAAAAVVVLAAVTAVPLVILVTLLGGAQSAQACAPPAPPGAGSPVRAGDLSAAEAAAAAVIVGVGEQLKIPSQGIVIALAAAAQESGFRNYANDGLGGDLVPAQRDVGRSMRMPHDAVGTDHGSVGVFQQQYPWWGTLEQLMSPREAAGKFYRALLKVSGWKSMPVTAAAQAVQRSAFPGAYADDEPLARELFAGLAGTGLAGTGLAGTGLAGTGLAGTGLAGTGLAGTGLAELCGTGAAMDCPSSGLAAERGLTPDAVRVLRCLLEEFGDHTYLGVGARPANADSDHPAGRAVDAMVADWDTPAGNAEGRSIADWVVANAAGLGVKYVIFDGKMWDTRRTGQGWLPYAHPSGATDPTSLHRDHVHVSVYGNAAGGAAGLSTAGWTLPIAPGAHTLTSGYGPRANPAGPGIGFHAGLDFAAPAGSPIRSAATGQVTFAGVSGGYGNLVIVRTGNVETYYAHQLDGGIRVVSGQRVRAGQQIGVVGSTGHSTGNHLHFEVRVDGASTDPAAFLQKYGVELGNLP